jgi:hypothetical protein
MEDQANTNVPAIPNDFATKLMAGIAQSRATTQIGAGGKPILRLLKDGIWVFGQNNEEVQEGSQWVVNPMSLAHGWVCWLDSQIVGQVMVSMAADPPPRPAAVNGREYEAQRSFDMKCITGDDAGTEVVYKVSSMGGVERITDLIGLIRPQLLTAHPCPVLVLGQDYYTHKKYGRIYKPIFDIVGWADMNGNIAGAAAPALEAATAVTAASVASAATAAPAASGTTAMMRKRKKPLTEAAPAPAAAAPPPAAVAPPLQPAPVAQAHTGQRRRPGAR